MISVVNGYLCYSSCDAAKAKQGKDPNTPPGTPADASKTDKSSGFAGQPATILDGALKDSVTASAVTASSGTTNAGAASSSTVNVLV